MNSGKGINQAKKAGKKVCFARQFSGIPAKDNKGNRLATRRPREENLSYENAKKMR